MKARGFFSQCWRLMEKTRDTIGPSATRSRSRPLSLALFSLLLSPLNGDTLSLKLPSGKSLLLTFNLPSFSHLHLLNPYAESNLGIHIPLMWSYGLMTM